MTGKYDPSRYAIVSSGDPEEDQRAIERHIVQTMRIDEGLCPNHPDKPAELIEVSPSTWQCPQCRFQLHRRTIHVR